MLEECVPSPGERVRVAVTVPAPRSDVWPAVTDTGRVARWLGNLSAPMSPGRALRIDFGDGDFFELGVDEIKPEELVSFRWRFLGVGPESTVRWNLEDSGMGGTTVTVDDYSPRRPPVEGAQLRDGWQDFLDRLSLYLATGESARYAWREVIDGTADLPPSLWQPLRAETVVDWLPVTMDGQRATFFFIVDEDGPRRFAVQSWLLARDTSLRFSVVLPDLGVVPCELTATPSGPGTRLAVSHTGWRGLRAGDLTARALRHRFAAAWQEALRQAEGCAQRAPKPIT